MSYTPTTKDKFRVLEFTHSITADFAYNFYITRNQNGDEQFILPAISENNIGKYFYLSNAQDINNMVVVITEAPPLLANNGDATNLTDIRSISRLELVLIIQDNTYWNIYVIHPA